MYCLSLCLSVARLISPPAPRVWPGGCVWSLVNIYLERSSAELFPKYFSLTFEMSGNSNNSNSSDVPLVQFELKYKYEERWWWWWWRWQEGLRHPLENPSSNQQDTLLVILITFGSNDRCKVQDKIIEEARFGRECHIKFTPLCRKMQYNLIQGRTYTYHLRQ